MTAKERERAEREEALRRRRLSVRVGIAGLTLVFLSGILIILVPDYLVVLLGMMLLGVALLVVAFVLIQGAARSLKTLTKTL